MKKQEEKAAKPTKAPHQDFDRVLEIIREGRSRAFQAVNTTLIETYWAVGEFLSTKVVQNGWGKGSVEELAAWLSASAIDVKGFSASNLWRMKQFFEAYRYDAILAPLVRELPWTHNLLILGRTKSDEERDSYVRSATRAKWT